MKPMLPAEKKAFRYTPALIAIYRSLGGGGGGVVTYFVSRVGFFGGLSIYY